MEIHFVQFDQKLKSLKPFQLVQQPLSMLSFFYLLFFQVKPRKCLFLNHQKEFPKPSLLFFLLGWASETKFSIWRPFLVSESWLLDCDLRNHEVLFTRKFFLQSFFTRHLTEELLQ